MFTFDINLNSRQTATVNGEQVYDSGNTLAIPAFIANTAVQAGIGAAWTTASHWVGSSILRSAGHDGYSITGSQFAAPALIGLAAGPSYAWGKSLLGVAMPSLASPAATAEAKLARFVGELMLGGGHAALVGVLGSLIAHRRGDATYPAVAQSAALSVTGNVVASTALAAATLLLAGGCLVLGCRPRHSDDIEMAQQT